MNKWLLVNELHRQARRNFPRRQVVMRGIDDTIQADLVEMIPYASENGGMKYILTAINIFSKKAYVRAVRNKSGKEVTRAMTSILDSLGHPIQLLHVDNGKEFYNKSMQDMLHRRNIKMYSVYTTKKAGIIERFNRTYKNLMWKQFSMRGSYKWIDLLDKLLDEYNNRNHRTIRMKPNDVDKSVERYLLDTVYRPREIPRIKTKFKVGDHVRMSRYKYVFDKGYTPNWTTEIFKIKQVQQTNPLTYLLVDSDGRDIKGSVYKEELQLVHDPRLFLVEKIIRKRDDQVFVKWLGFDSSHNSWISAKNVLD